MYLCKCIFVLHVQCPLGTEFGDSLKRYFSQNTSVGRPNHQHGYFQGKREMFFFLPGLWVALSVCLIDSEADSLSSGRGTKRQIKQSCTVNCNVQFNFRWNLNKLKMLKQSKFKPLPQQSQRWSVFVILPRKLGPFSIFNSAWHKL